MRRLARVQPGVVLDHLRNAAERHHLTFGPDPATHNRCTLGGMIGNNSCGVHSVMAGKTDDNIEELEILTYDGTAHESRRDQRAKNSSGSFSRRAPRPDLCRAEEPAGPLLPISFASTIPTFRAESPDTT